MLCFVVAYEHRDTVLIQHGQGGGVLRAASGGLAQERLRLVTGPGATAEDPLAAPSTAGSSYPVAPVAP